MTTRSPCERCKGADCRRCKGTGFRSRERKSRGRLMMVQKEGVWLIQTLFGPCWRCEGTGKRPDHSRNGSDAGGPPQPCQDCKETGLRPDPLRSPRLAENAHEGALPGKPDLTSPESAFEAYAKRHSIQRLRSKLLEAKLAPGFMEFARFFLVDPPAPRKRVVEVPQPKVLELKRPSEGKAVVLWKTVERRKTKLQTDEADGKVDLEKGADGLWRVSALYDKCWCRYGKGRQPKRDCKECDNTGWRSAR